MKIAFTISDATDAAHVGGEVERRTAIVEIPDEQLPPMVRQYMEGTRGNNNYQSMSISLVDEFMYQVNALGLGRLHDESDREAGE